MSGGLISFVLQAVAVSLSGVIAPGPVTAATLAAGTRLRHAGSLIALGHVIVEAPLMLLIMAGMSRVFIGRTFTIAVGLIGGVLLILMAAQILRAMRKPEDPANAPKVSSPVWTGVVLTGGNPYFLLWWVTVGIAFMSRALELGVLAFALFAIIHWMCDILWLEILSLASFKGTHLFGRQTQKVVLAACSLSMLLIGLWFIVDAGRKLAR